MVNVARVRFENHEENAIGTSESEPRISLALKVKGMRGIGYRELMRWKLGGRVALRGWRFRGERVCSSHRWGER